MTTPRPDQSHAGHQSVSAGSRSGAGDIAGALGYPGSPAAVQNMQTAAALKRGVTGSPWVLITFTAPARIWTVVLSYAIRTDSAFAPGTAGVFAAVETLIGGLTLATVNLGLAAPSTQANGQSEPPIPGIPVTQGESVILDVNGGTDIPNLLQFAGAIIFYSIP